MRDEFRSFEFQYTVTNSHPFFLIFCSIYRGFRATAISAVTAATKRSMQLGGISEKDISHKYNL